VGEFKVNKVTSGSMCSKPHTSSNRVAPGGWEVARAMFENGASKSEIAKALGVSLTMVKSHANLKKWPPSAEVRNSTPEVKALTIAKYEERYQSNVSLNKADLDRVIDVSAEKLAVVINRHRQEWLDHLTILNEAMNNRDFERAKLAKITSETISIRQAGERKAWGLDTVQRVDVRTSGEEDASRTELSAMLGQIIKDRRSDSSASIQVAFERGSAGTA